MNEEKAPFEAIKTVSDQSKTTWFTKENLKMIAKESPFFLLTIAAVILFRIYVAEPYLVDGRSMDPTFGTGDYLIVEKISELKRNEVVVFNATDAGYPKRNFIKRIIGLPGETVIVKDNTVKIINSANPDGFVVDQSYVTHTAKGSYQKTLAGDEYFVMGDNRTESFDSRYWGSLHKTNIIGTPILRLLPLKSIALMPGKDNK